MIIGQVGLPDASSALRIIERRLNRAMNPTTYTADEFIAKIKSTHHFIATVMGPKKLFILGDPCEFRRTFGALEESRLNGTGFPSPMFREPACPGSD
jgi:hypothetical protein